MLSHHCCKNVFTVSTLMFQSRFYLVELHKKLENDQSLTLVNLSESQYSQQPQLDF